PNQTRYRRPDFRSGQGAAQGLLAGRDETPIPTLIDLLTEQDVRISWHAEELLHWLAGKESPAEIVGSATYSSRQRCQAAWKEWRLRNGRPVDWEVLRLVLLQDECARQPTTPGRLNSDLPANGRVYAVDEENQPFWKLVADSWVIIVCGSVLSLLWFIWTLF